MLICHGRTRWSKFCPECGRLMEAGWPELEQYIEKEIEKTERSIRAAEAEIPENARDETFSRRLDKSERIVANYKKWVQLIHPHSEAAKKQRAASQ